MEGEPVSRFRFGRIATWVLLAVIGVTVVLSIAWVILQWSIAEAVYSAKANLDWFGITFYHNYLFVAAAFFGLLFVYPRVGGSDLRGLIEILGRRMRRDEFEQEERPRTSGKMNPWLWAIWQTIKWALGFYAFVTLHGFPLLGETMNSIMMTVLGIGSWGDIPRIFVLPLFPASGQQLVTLMPSMQVQYAVVSYVASAVLLVFATRMVFRFFTNLTTRRSDVWIKNLVAVVAAVILEVVIGAPYWLMNIATPYVYGITWTLFLLAVAGYFYISHRRDLLRSRVNVFKVIAVVFAALLVIQVGAGAYLYFNWNNNYLPYQWTPQTQKEITVTRWAAGLNNIRVSNITSLPTSNPTTTLNLVRQWDQTAATVTNTKEIGAYNWMGLASSEIVFDNNSEYWDSPTTPTVPSPDWISEHLI
ncbi:MAG: hypothetical protein OK474_11190, partial [Thaumarchaeota archaeon]|nr:hypothetical protein [Nitrososphaerota archaeon]